MICLPTIAIALLLLSLTAGTWLLYKTQKENLGTLFKVIAWFVLIVSFCSIICCGLHCVVHHYRKGERNNTEYGRMGEREHGFGHGMWMMRGHGRGMMGFHRRMMYKEGDESEMTGTGSGRDKMEMEMKKDSVVINKKK